MKLASAKVFNTVEESVPNEGIWVGRCFISGASAYKGISGPHVVIVTDGTVYDVSPYFLTTSELINSPNPVEKIKSFKNLNIVGDLNTILTNSLFYKRDHSQPYLLAPNDILSIKACGVTFVQSMLERVIEEKAKGDFSKATEIRALITKKIGASLQNIAPGSEKAEQLKIELQKLGVWSQYLEVGIGKDAEIFTKSQPLSSVTFGDQIGVLKDSSWNNPEPEVVLAVSNEGEIRGAALGNDVNLRDYEGRSALLLGEAKDQNGSCSIGPLIRLFDGDFTLENVKNARIELKIYGEDGFEMAGESNMASISRDVEELVKQAIGKNHQYPDGLMLFCGTMFAPSEDRIGEGKGFTHKLGDRVDIHSEKLGTLVNWVGTCDTIPPWNFGINSLLKYLIKRRC